MMKKILKVILVIAIILFVILTVKVSINESFVKDYERNKTNEWKVQYINMINIYEPYVALKNYGDYYYLKGEYRKAVEKYDEALKHSMSNARACDTRINATLSLMKLADKNKKNKDEREKLLKEAQKYIEDGDCMNESFFNYQNKSDAEKLDSEIEQELNKLKNGTSQDGESSDEENDGDSDSDEDTQSSNPKINEIQKSNQAAQEARDERMGKYKDDYDSSFKGKPW